jgi:hypothetical protein
MFSSIIMHYKPEGSHACYQGELVLKPPRIQLAPRSRVNQSGVHIGTPKVFRKLLNPSLMISCIMFREEERPFVHHRCNSLLFGGPLYTLVFLAAKRLEETEK